MRKQFEKFLIISLGVLIFGGIPGAVNAAEYSFGKAIKESNVTKVPIILEVGSGENIDTGRLGCATDSTEVSCEVAVKEGGYVNGINDQSGLVFTYIGDGTNKYFPAGSHEIVYLVLTNESSAKNSNLKVSLKNATIGGIPKSLSFGTEVGAKPEEKPASDDATLKGIKFSQGTISPEFKSDVFEYTVYNIADTINSVRITPTCNEGECTYDVSGGKSVSGMTVTLNQGANTIKVEVTSQLGNNSKTYTFTVYRGETVFNSAKLGSLEFGDYTLTPAFSKEVKEYSLTIPTAVNNLIDVIKYEAEDKNAKVSVTGLDNLVIGTNTIKIVVDNVNGDETITYTINVTRMSDAEIEILKYINDEVTFKDADGITSTLKMEEFKIQYPDYYNKIMNGEYKFDKDGNIIIETEEEPVEKDTVKKESDKTWLIVVIVLVGLVIIAASGILIFKKKPNKEEIEDKKDETKESIEEINEEGVEESIIGNDFSKDADATVDIDEALSDLMSTKQYEFKDKEDGEE